MSLEKLRSFCALLLCMLALTSCSKPEPPRVTPRAARVTSVGPNGLGLSVDLDVYNPNSFPLLARSVTGKLEIGTGIEVGNGRAEPQGSIPAKGSSLVTSEIALSLTNLAAFAPFALSNQPVPYTFRGVASIGGESLNVDVPFKVTGELTREQIMQAGMRGLSVPVP
jgi:LEA14-like dessication related protein